MVIYARFERDRSESKKQLLKDHILGTTEKIEKLLQATIVRHILQSLTEYVNTNYIKLIQAAKLAALFHDIGKILWYYQKRAVNVEKQVEEALTFPMHEVVSASIYVQTCNMYRQLKLRYPITPTWLISLTVQAILLHHQGLRVLTIERIQSNYVNQMIYEDYNENIENLKIITTSLLNMVKDSTIIEVFEVLRNNVNEVLKYNSREIQDFYYLQDSIQVELSRMITACLMIADSWDAYEAVKGRKSKYIQEIVLRYIKTLT
ncbi:MAG: CRISPR-associated endonuclease Cas3'' [Candidatus Methanomethylicia archaeon]